MIVYGYVEPHGLATGYAFQYGTTSGYGGQTPLAPAGSGTKSIKVSQTITGLQAGTTYHYRIVAVNGAGLTDGKDRTFKTASVPLSLQITGVPNPVVFGSPFLVEGTLSGTGAANRAIALQVNPFPYLRGFQIAGNPELTNATGGFSFPYLGLLENAQVRVMTVGKPEVTSPVVLESVAVRVSFHAARTRRRGYARLYGTVAPAEVGALVGFQLLQPGNSINEGGTVVKAGTSNVSQFSRIVRIRHPGVYRALVKIRRRPRLQLQPADSGSLKTRGRAGPGGRAHQTPPGRADHSSSERCSASSTLTTRRPLRPSERGVAPVRTHCTKCSHSSRSGSRLGMRGE